MTHDSQFLTPKEVAEILGVHQKTVHLWLRTGKLAGTKISYRAWRIPQSALDSFVEQNSNISLHGPMATRKEAKVDSSRATPPPRGEHAGDPLTSPQSKMKHYLRDIMGEESPDRSDHT
jgi:excisionase family DNA binding protein